MKIEISEKKPEHYKEYWPMQYDIFSHFEYTCGVPSVMFLITTLKENGNANACLHAWSTFSGDKGGFFAILPGLMQHTHTYHNILREKEFCINFLRPEYYDACQKTIAENKEEIDELAIAGFTAEPSRLIKAPRIKEAFLSYECTFESACDLSGAGINAMVIGRVRHAAVEETNYIIENICSEGSFMFNIHSPKNPVSGEGEQSAVAKLTLVKPLNE
ncbi:flavin reductase family protein [Acetanaerobacterium elongatum]|uniref:NADH-FMN oxidoreductase RutF, flavin reductase (DIM6/NTAB) family n=1 Tax=Acetanaerobacterium elongatum TaxID=258515 RepID=A0A1G9VSL1_9FIRM|nr:flavin reductase [Acetanaerobacterium elongatum]SDM75027.1 NADH-FMN oxidoreductase RutF, flavin reductase (DIM6/NTAB) family [Acetanaerobacterium elongatum]